MAEFPLLEAIAGKDVSVEWMPFELRPFPSPTLRPEGDYLRTAWANSVYPLARQMGINIVLPRVSPQPYSDRAFEGFQYAREHGKAGEYNHRVFTAFFQEQQDIGKIEVLTELAGEIGLHKLDFRSALESRHYQEAHRRALHHAQSEAGISSVPTFVIGRQVLQGLQTRETLERVIHEELAAQDSSSGGTV